ncbi:hypothetical protein G7084_01380 [Weissella coleopterorum]|uniref:YopX protein domain-containing protein n=1 Tax=Weissella coleopterorum TaxID=2714949 RepID=A0A6G8AYP9_9LACO|nr:YopX family protein [Weissella coleopterorum]QIL50089.1 hypothetical protein G7084_01380 [Weissella coleopterorum]
MREIKFRAWDINSGKYVEDTTNYYLRLSDHNVFISGGRVLFKNITNDLILEQYTGVKDESGQEVYEGDILIDPDDNRVYGVVTFDNGEFSANGDRLYDEVASTFVGGNIHENPELLEGE